MISVENKTINTEMNLLSIQHVDNNLMITDIDISGSIDQKSLEGKRMNKSQMNMIEIYGKGQDIEEYLPQLQRKKRKKSSKPTNGRYSTIEFNNK